LKIVDIYPSVVLRSMTDRLEQKFSLCADLAKALVWADIILPCCLCLFDFFYLCAAMVCHLVAVLGLMHRWPGRFL